MTYIYFFSKISQNTLVTISFIGQTDLVMGVSGQSVLSRKPSFPSKKTTANCTLMVSWSQMAVALHTAGL